MSEWNLAEIRAKVRQVTGRFATSELSNSQMDEYINKYFQFTFPAELKLERFESFYEFLTSPNQQSYDFPSTYVSFEPLATIDRMELEWFQDPSTFYEVNYQGVSSITVGTGDGSTTAFSSTATDFPILPATAVITDNTEVFQDTNTTYTTSNVAITGSLGGTATVNYETGVMSVTFNTAPANGQLVTFSYIQFTATRPNSVLMYNNQFTFFPVPDTAYRFRVKAYANSLVTTAAGTTATLFTAATDKPLLQEWGPCIAYGTSRDIHADFGEMDAYAEVTALYREQQAYILRRTTNNLLNVRAMPQF